MVNSSFICDPANNDADQIRLYHGKNATEENKYQKFSNILLRWLIFSFYWHIPAQHLAASSWILGLNRLKTSLAHVDRLVFDRAKNFQQNSDKASLSFIRLANCRRISWSKRIFLKKSQTLRAVSKKGVGILQMIKNGWIRNFRPSDFIFSEFRLFKFFRLSSLLKNDPISWITYVLHNRDKNRHPAIKWEIEADYQLKGRVDFRQNLFCSSNAGCISFFSVNERTTELANCFVCQRNSFFLMWGQKPATCSTQYLVWTG